MKKKFCNICKKLTRWSHGACCVCGYGEIEMTTKTLLMSEQISTRDGATNAAS